MRAEHPERDARPGCWAVGFGIVAAPVLIAGVAAAALHLALLYTKDLLLVWAAVGTLAFMLSVLFRRRRPGWLAAGGFLAGASVPVVLRILGVLSDTGLSRWSDYLAHPKLFLLAGVAGALIVPWLVRLAMRPGKTGRPAFVFLAAAVLAGLWLAPLAVKARSCHNPSRNSTRPVPPVTAFEVGVPVGDWALLRGELVRYAEASGWQVWSDVRADPSFPWFEVSLCRPSGTELSFLLNPQKENAIEVDVYQPQGGTGWERAVQAVQAPIARRWPGSLRPVDTPDLAFTPWPRADNPRRLLRKQKSL